MAGVNDLEVKDVALILGAIYAKATGEPLLWGADDTGAFYDHFVSIAQKTLRNGTDPVMNALSQVLSKTVFAVRPYEAKLKILEMDNIQWGNIVRKINYADHIPVGSYSDSQIAGQFGLDFSDPTYLEGRINGTAPDVYAAFGANPWTGRDIAAVQTNFYGTEVAAESFKIRDEALRGAFKGPEEFSAFINGAMTYMQNRHEQFIETLARGAVINYIMGRYVQGNVGPDRMPDRTIHLLTEYNRETGLSLTATTVMQPENFKPFMAWVFGKIAAISDMMTERSSKYATPLYATVPGQAGLKYPVLRHTPKRDQKLLLYSPIQHMSAARALADTYHDNYLKYTDVEFVNFWQDINEPDKITLTNNDSIGYTSETGSGALENYVPQGDDGVTTPPIFGVLFDRNALGYMRQNVRVLTSPYNAADQSYTIWWHEAGKYVNDFTEKGVVLLLD